MASPPFAWARATATLLLVASTLSDLSTAGLLILIVSLVVAFGFESVNGFHDTSNAVATVIYTHSLKPVQAVVWSGPMELRGRAVCHHHRPRRGVLDRAPAAGRAIC